ncbi:MAG: hypothetical protein ABIH72_00875 [archaeon]
MKKAVYKAMSAILFLLGGVFILSSASGLTGYVIFEGVKSNYGFFIGLILLAGGLLGFIFSGGRSFLPAAKLEDIVESRTSSLPDYMKERQFIIFDEDFLSGRFKTSKHRLTYLKNLIAEGYSLVVPNSLKEEFSELEKLEGTVSFSKSPGYSQIKGEALELLKRTEKYQEGARLLAYTTPQEVPRRLMSRFANDIKALEELGKMKGNTKKDWVTLRNYVEKQYTDLDVDSDILASAIYGGRSGAVVVVSGDSRIDQTIHALKAQDYGHSKNIIYISPQEDKIVT